MYATARYRGGGARAAKNAGRMPALQKQKRRRDSSAILVGSLQNDSAFDVVREQKRSTDFGKSAPFAKFAKSVAPGNSRAKADPSHRPRKARERIRDDSGFD
jgi:hypothetical protein